MGKLILAAMVMELGMVSIAAADSPVSLAPKGRIVWACSRSGVVGLSANTGAVVFDNTLGAAYCSELASGTNGVWLAGGETNSSAGVLAKINVATGAAKTVLKLRDGAVRAVATSARRVWIIGGTPDRTRVLIVNAATGHLIGSLAGVKDPVAVAADDSGVWIATAQRQLLHAGTKARAANYVRSLPADTMGGLTAPPVLSLGSGSVWVSAGEAIVRVDERSRKVTARIRVPGTPFSLAAGDGAVWACVLRLPSASRLLKVDVRDDTVTHSVSVPFASSSVGVGAGGVWLGLARADPRVFRVDPHSLQLHLLAHLR